MSCRECFSVLGLRTQMIRVLLSISNSKGMVKTIGEQKKMAEEKM